MNTHPEFSQAQWKFIAALEALGTPASVDLLGNLVPLTPGPLVDVIARATAADWIRQDDGHILSLAPELPDQVRSELARINTPTQAGRLLKRLRTIGQHDDAHARVYMEANLMELSGAHLDAALFEFHAAMQCIESGKLCAALTMSERIIARIADALPDSDLNSLYIQAVLLYARLSYLLGQGIVKTPQILKAAMGLAVEGGDYRSLALIKMYIGMFHYLHNDLDAALSLLKEGLDGAAELGDEDILIQSAEFQGFYYYIQGLYREAYEAFELAIETAAQRSNHLDNYYLPIFLGQSAAILGRFHRAIGILEVSMRKARMDGKAEIATLNEAMLGHVLLRMGRKHEAVQHLHTALRDAREQRNDRALYFAQRGIAYHHYLEGRLKEVERMVHEFSYDKQYPSYTWPTGPQYIWPVILEVTFVLLQAGCEPPQGYNVEKDVERILKGSNYNLRGTVYRLQAQHAVHMKGDQESIRALLLKSEADLLRSADPLELAKTHIELARFELKANHSEPARRYALQAWEEMSGHWEEYFPGDLRILVKPGNQEAAGEQAGDTMLDGFIDILDAFVPSADEGELLNRLMSATCHFFGAERGALFWFQDTDAAAPLAMRAAYNLMSSDIEDETFRHSLGLIRKVFHNNQPLLIHSPEGSSSRIICLPIEINGQAKGVLYHENMYITEGFHRFDRKLLMRISRHISAYIERVGAYCRLIEELSLSASRQSEIRILPADGDIVAGSDCMRKLLQRFDQVANSDATVLILGETGVGKELLARRVHAMSPRNAGPFVTVDLTSISENLLESELFGHEKGAFTGADRQKPGRIELADKGTLFLDEVGEIPLSVQVKLLRALQERSFVRVGGTRALHPDFRLIAATNRDLAKEVEKGCFREDLFYRLNVVPLLVPPLRERGDDAVILAMHFLAYYERKYSRGPLTLTAMDRKRIKGYSWPGNVRELKNAMERAAILSTPGQLELVLPLEKAPEGEAAGETDAVLTLEELERRHILHVMEITKGKIGGPDGASHILGINRSTLYYRMKKLGIA